MSKSAKRKRRARRAEAPKVGSDFGPPERGQHDIIVIDRPSVEDSRTRERARVRGNDPLAHYRKRGKIDSAQRDAGRRLRAIAQDAGVQQRVIPKYGGMVGRGSVVAAMTSSLDNRGKFDAAMNAVPSRCRNAVFVVCVQEQLVLDAHVPLLRVGLRHLAVHLEHGRDI